MFGVKWPASSRLFRGFQVRGKVPVPRAIDRIRIGRSKIQWGASYFDLLRIFHRDISRVIRDIHERARAEEDLNWKVVPRLRSEIRVISSRVFKAHFSE